MTLPRDAVKGTPDLGVYYRETRERLSGFLADLDTTSFAVPVPACPGWSVQDVLAHLVAVAEDVLAGRLTEPPPDDVTAAQVARFGGRDVQEILELWEEVSPGFEEIITSFSIWPAALDIASHE